MKQSLTKKERLSGKNKIKEVLEKGTQVAGKIFKYSYLFSNNETNQTTEICFSAPKVIFKKAHTRNKTKRMLREAYRLNKNQLIDFCKNEKKSIKIFFVAIKQETFKKTSDEMALTIKKIIN